MRRAKDSILVVLLTLSGAEGRGDESPQGDSLGTQPQLVSPGGKGREGRVGTGCPTFSWAEMPGATGYELTIYEVGATGFADVPAPEPLLRERFPAGVSAWTPDLADCLPPGRYGWAVGASLEGSGADLELRWSKVAVFRVESAGIATTAPDPHGRERSPAQAAPSADIRPPLSAPGEGAAAGPRSINGAARFIPPDCSGMFSDVTEDDPLCDWIEQFARDGLSLGCGGGKYCPDLPVTRRQIAMIVEKAMRGTLSWGPARSGPRVTTVDAAPAEPPTASIGEYTSIAIGEDGLPVISYLDRNLFGLKVMHCNDVACTGGDETTFAVDTSGTVGLSTAIAIGADGFPIISYYDVDNTSLKVAHCNDVACSPFGIGVTRTTVDNTGALGFYSSIAIGAGGLPVISYRDQDSDSLKVVRCNDAACAPGGESFSTVDDTANLVGYYSSIAIGTDGMPIISYQDQTDFNLKVAHCNDPACAPGGEIITPLEVSANIVGAFTSIAIGADGFPIISYYDATNTRLRVAHCNDVACAPGGEKLSTVDDTGFVGQYTSIAIGVDGLPVISYYDDAGTLKVAHCNDIACADNDETLTTVDDPANFVGWYTDTAIGADGVPIISYYDQSGALKVVHCGTLSCSP